VDGCGDGQLSEWRDRVVPRGQPRAKRGLFRWYIGLSCREVPWFVRVVVRVSADSGGARSVGCAHLYARDVVGRAKSTSAESRMAKASVNTQRTIIKQGESSSDSYRAKISQRELATQRAPGWLLAEMLQETEKGLRRKRAGDDWISNKPLDVFVFKKKKMRQESVLT
jgi:hypothetical protein